MLAMILDSFRDAYPLTAPASEGGGSGWGMGGDVFGIRGGCIWDNGRGHLGEGGGCIWEKGREYLGEVYVCIRVWVESVPRQIFRL